MAKMVGYACSVRKPWHDMAVKMLEENYSEEDYKKELNAYLAYEIDSETRLRKTREILMNIWFYDREEKITSARKIALEALKKCAGSESAVYYCMTCLTYPVFAEVCTTLGKLVELQNEITTPALKQRLYDSWGERGTLEATARRVTLTLKELDILADEVRGKYTVKKKELTNKRIVEFAIFSALLIDDCGYSTASEIKENPVLFPFKYDVDIDAIMDSELFEVANYGGERTISIK